MCSLEKKWGIILSNKLSECEGKVISLDKVREKIRENIEKDGLRLIYNFKKNPFLLLEEFLFLKKRIIEAQKKGIKISRKIINGLSNVDKKIDLIKRVW
ncbi:MAG: hypothetical protein KAI16_01435 [Candidatus Pacebacteria bacterium]|nr:hypothetical protein [Candidatus Paceibacterota bacterium]